jgi:hypothetical protein
MPSKSASYSWEGCLGRLIIVPSMASPARSAMSLTQVMLVGKRLAPGKTIAHGAALTLPHSSALMKLPRRPKV